MRKTQIVEITAQGRDEGKKFLLKEMPAGQVEKFAARAFLALAKGGVEIPDGARDAGIVGLASIGVNGLAGLRFEDASPLMDEMMTCVSFMPDPKRPDITRGLVEDDIEEVSTRLKLRIELVNLHVGFSRAGAASS